MTLAAGKPPPAGAGGGKPPKLYKVKITQAASINPECVVPFPHAQRLRADRYVLGFSAASSKARKATTRRWRLLSWFVRLPSSFLSLSSFFPAFLDFFLLRGMMALMGITGVEHRHPDGPDAEVPVQCEVVLPWEGDEDDRIGD